MKFKYTLPKHWADKVSQMEEFANGAMQVTIKTKSGAVFEKVLISSATYPIAARGYKDLPFAIDEIDDIYQTAEDKNPSVRGNWDFWDTWPKP